VDQPASDVARPEACVGVAADLGQRQHQVLGADEAGGEMAVARLDVLPIIQMLFVGM
jgi:DNA gyrase inhibitor GyrI